MRSARFGGFISQPIIPGTLTKEFEEAAFVLNKNELSEPILTSRGYYLIMMLKKETSQLLPFEQEKEKLTGRFRMMKKKQIAENYINQLLIKYNPTIQAGVYPLLRKTYAEQHLNASKLTQTELNKTAVRFGENEWSVHDVIFFYNLLSSKDRIPLENKGDLVLIVQKLAIPYVMYLEAVANDLDKSDKIQSKIRRYLRERLITKYKKQEIDRKIKISDEQTRKFFTENREKWSGRSFESAKPYVRYYLFQEEQKQALTKLLDSLKTEYPLQYNEQTLTHAVELLNTLKI